MPTQWTKNGGRNGWLLNVMPRFAGKHTRDRALANAEVLRQGPERDTSTPQLAKLSHRIGRQFGLPLTFALWVWRRYTSPFCQHVVRVIACCAKEQVLGINARTVIAGVKNEQAWRDGASINEPSVAMRPELIATSNTKLTVAVVGETRCPLPAAISAAIDVVKKSCDGALIGWI